MGRVLSRAACGCSSAANALCSESTHAQLVNMMSRIVAHNRLSDGSLVEQNSVPGGGNLDSSVDLALFLTFTR